MNKILQGDCLNNLKSLSDNSVDAIVTDPPYGLSFMGKKWDYDVPSQEIWEECLRVLKPGGYLLSFAGTRTQHRMAVRIEDAGFEIRDMITWVYGSGFPKSLNIGKAVDKLQGNKREVIGKYQPASSSGDVMKTGLKNDDNLTKGTSEWEGWGTALKPALEPITVARKPFKGTVAENVLTWGTGGINIDGCRVAGINEQDKNNFHQNRKVVKEYTADGTLYELGMKTVSTAEHSLGRFPANLIHDGSDEVVGLFPNTGKGNGGKPYNYSGKEYDNKDTSMFNGDKPQAPSNFNDSGSASRFFYCAKASKSERNRGCEELESKAYAVSNQAKAELKRGNDFEGHEQGDWNAVKSNKNNHPTVKPIALMEYLVKLVSKEGAVVLDPFAGSGSTLIACKKLNRNYIGMELDPEYIKIAEARLNSV